MTTVSLTGLNKLKNEFTWKDMQDLSINDLIIIAREYKIKIDGMNKEEIIDKILEKIINPNKSLEIFRQQMLEFLPQKDVMSICFSQSENKPINCNDNNTWYNLLKTDYDIIYNGDNPKREYAIQYTISTISKKPDSDDSLWKLIDLVTRPSEFYSSNALIRQQIWHDLYYIKNKLPPHIITTLNSTYTRLSNSLLIQLAELDDFRSSSLYSYPNLIYFVDYIMSLGKLHFYLFREQPLQMITQIPLLYIQPRSSSSYSLITFPNFFLHRPYPPIDIFTPLNLSI